MPDDAAPRTAYQPYLFDLVSCVNAPSLVLSGRDGQIDGDGVQGWMCADRRLLSRLRVTLDGFEPVGLAAEAVGARGAAFRAVVPQLGDPIDDPTVVVERRREVDHDTLTETVRVSSSARREVRLSLEVEVAADFSEMAQVRTGRPRELLPPTADTAGLTWADGADTMRLSAEPAPGAVDPARGALRWLLELPPGGSATVRLHATSESSAQRPFGGTDRVPWSRPHLASADNRVAATVHRGVDDLEGLLLRDAAGGEDDLFVAAGSPWFLTLFGRDSLWAARMLLPLGTELAMSTLRVLARRQGTRDHPASEEQPGRILHEVRAEPLVLEHFTLPPTYYGTTDATQLFVTCLAEAWRWGADPAEVERLLPAVEAALGWMEAQAGDGFIKYVDTTGTGLANQGWKDSVDSIQWADGRLADPPIALSEVQGYAYQAAMHGADLLDAFGRPGGDRWRSWAAALAERFRAAFWVDDADGRYPAVALDAQGAAVDSVASNMGHLLGTGLLDEGERALVAARLGSPQMDSGFGLRTLTSASPRFSRLSYHGGAVWPHDTAIAVVGLARDGFGEVAASLFRGLVRVSPQVEFRMPELYGGDAADEVGVPTPYPAACRPQAWSAAAPLAALVALLGLEVDVPGGTVSARPVLPASLLPVSLTGLRAGGHDLAVTVEAGGRLSIVTDHPDIRVT